MKSVLKRLNRLLNEFGDESQIMFAESVLIDSIEETIKEESFYSLPTNEILKIICESEVSDSSILSHLVSRMNERNYEEAVLILNVIESKNATFEECINIISKLNRCQICNRIGELFENEKKLPSVDYLSEINRMKKEITTPKRTKVSPQKT